MFMLKVHLKNFLGDPCSVLSRLVRRLKKRKRTTNFWKFFYNLLKKNATQRTFHVSFKFSTLMNNAVLSFAVSLT